MTDHVKEAASRMASIIGVGCLECADVLNALVAEGFIAILPRQSTLEVIVPVLVATTDKARAYATAIIDLINRLTGRRFKVGDGEVRQAKALIRNKVTLDQALAAVRAKYEEWGAKPEMVQYIQPSTLMRPSNMKKYISQLEAGPARMSSGDHGFQKLGE